MRSCDKLLWDEIVIRRRGVRVHLLDDLASSIESDRQPEIKS